MASKSSPVERRMSWALAPFFVVGLCAVQIEAELGPAYAQPPEGPVPEKGQREVRVENPEALKRMEAHVRSLYEPRDVRHSFALTTGDEIDCVDINKQPGLRRPEMRGHRILTPPSALPAPAARERAGPSNPSTPETGFKLATQEGLLDGRKDARGRERKCPPMSIPVRRVTIDELKASKNLKEFFSKYQKESDLPPTTPPAAGSSAEHQYAHAARYYLTNYGAHTVLNIWNPKVQVSSEFSLSQIWVTRGYWTATVKTLETVEAGVQAFRNKYGDGRARLFVYSTSDAYSGNSYWSGCYNLDCYRFVQTNSSWVLGGPFANYSVDSSSQYEVELTWLRTSGAWWLAVNGTWIGYYPLNLFDSSGIRDYASTIDFGGEIYEVRSAHPYYHTTTDMGSYTEQYPAVGYGRAAYQKKIWYYSSPTTPVWATGLTPLATNKYCYDVSTPAYNYYWGVYFYFNGPGWNYNCQ
jgi:hypothetical protein